MTTQIPSPPAVPFLGHVNAIDKDLPLKSISLLAKQYGEIYQVNIFGERPSPALGPVTASDKIIQGASGSSPRLTT